MLYPSLLLSMSLKTTNRQSDFPPIVSILPTPIMESPLNVKR